MPVTEQTPVVTHNGNGVTTVFAYNYKILAAADMEVTVDGVVKTLTTHYSVSGVGSDGGGNVTMVTAPASGTANVVLRRSMAYSRSTDYQDNGDLLAVTADEDADRPIMMIQQLLADITRAMKLPVGVTTDQVLSESAADRVGKLVSFDASGNMVLAAAADVDLATVSAFMATLLDDVDAAAARATLGFTKGADVASANALTLGTDGTYFDITGTTAITSIGTLGVGTVVRLHFDGALTFTHHATDLILPGGANITTAAGTEIELVEYATGDWRMTGGVKADGAAWVLALGIGIQDFRLTLATGSPVPTTDQTAKTTIYCTPYKGKQISLYDGANWNTRQSAEFSLALGTLTNGKPYDVFCYDNAGVPTLEFLAWTNDTTRATALAYQDGKLVKSGAATRLYLGSFYTTATTTTEDSLTKRYLWNYYHRVGRPMLRRDSTASWTYSTATYRQANNSTSNQLNFMVGVSEDAVSASFLGRVINDTSTYRDVGAGIALDSVTTPSGLSGPIQVNNTIAIMRASYAGFPGAGRHYLAWIESGGGADTQTWYGNSGTVLTGIEGVVMA